MNSRILTNIECGFEYKNLSYFAVVKDLSQRGARLASVFLPPKEAQITLTIRSQHLQKILVLEGEVVYSSRVLTGQGQRGLFGVRFNRTPLELITLLSKLLAA